jgi:integrase
VHHGDIAQMHRKISESIVRYGPRRVRANRILALASKMFSLSLVPLPGENTPWRNPVQGNPCRGVERNHEEGREKFYSITELAAISDAIAEYQQGPSADCLRLIMLCGCRPAEAMGAAWQEFDEQPGFWIKPASTTKQRKVHRLPLGPPAIELLDRLRKNRTGKWVFPGDVPGAHLATLWRIWEHVRKHANLGKGARIYDLRHSYASHAAGGGVSLPIIGRLLGHALPRTTQRYAHFSDDPLAAAAEKVAAVITGAGKPGAEVVSIKRR